MQRLRATNRSGLLLGLGNMTYDAVARHPAFCDRVQLYDVASDPLEQDNLARAQPRVYAELLGLILKHVQRVEAGNPAVARRLTRTSLSCLADASGGNGTREVRTSRACGRSTRASTATGCRR